MTSNVTLEDPYMKLREFALEMRFLAKKTTRKCSLSHLYCIYLLDQLQ